MFPHLLAVPSHTASNQRKPFHIQAERSNKLNFSKQARRSHLTAFFFGLV